MAFLKRTDWKHLDSKNNYNVLEIAQSQITCQSFLTLCSKIAYHMTSRLEVK